MKNIMSAREAAKLWGISDRRVAVLCKEGRIEGAFKEGRSWFIPIDAEKPVDRRIVNNRRDELSKILPLPVGVSDFKEAVSNYYYVDKTLLIKEFLDEIPKVSLFTRPRRFGKTLNMDMLRVFLKKQMKILRIISKIKKYGSLEKDIEIFRGNILSFLLVLKMSNMMGGMRHFVILRHFWQKNFYVIRNS